MFRHTLEDFRKIVSANAFHWRQGLKEWSSRNECQTLTFFVYLLHLYLSKDSICSRGSRHFLGAGRVRQQALRKKVRPIGARNRSGRMLTRPVKTSWSSRRVIGTFDQGKR
ncbi:hypothetical protein ScPMuIL_012440 [Solemya velum]